MATIGATAVVVTPWMIGSRTPTFQKPTDWISVAIPQVNRSALMRWIVVFASRFSCPAMSSGTTTAPA